MTYRVADTGTLLADIREQARRALQARLIARIPQAERSQLVAAVTRHVRDMNETQIATWHTLLDHQEPT